jgi:hypothetical protein
MFVVQISFLIVTFLSFISQILSLMQTIKEVNPHPRVAPCVNMWSVFFFFFLCHLLNVGACICHILWEGQGEWTTLHSVTCYTNSIVSRIHLNTTKLCNITCTLVATDVILRSLECTSNFNHPRWLAARVGCIALCSRHAYSWDEKENPGITCWLGIFNYHSSQPPHSQCNCVQ